MYRLSFWALLLGLAAHVYAQTGTGTIRGTVYDAARATVPGATLVLTNQATNVAATTSTSETGFFLFSGLQPGQYQLTAESAGFKKWVGSILLQAGQIAVVEPALEVGSVDTIIEVTGAAPVISTESSELGSVKDNARIEQLPLNGRSITTLFNLTPGVEGGGNPRINGLKVGSADITLDGVSLVDRFGGGVARVQPGLDIVQEFRIETVGSGAQYSRPATVTVVTKGGTNELHGAVFETFRNNGAGLRARRRQDFSDPSFLVRNEFGASVGGPVYLPGYDGRNKSFWFAAYEGLRQSQKVFSQARVPTAAMWGGDLSNITDANSNVYTIYDPLTTNAEGLRVPFPNNVIPSDRISPFAAAMRDLTHEPTTNVNPYLGTNMAADYPLRTDTNNWTFRGDHHINESNILSGRLTRSSRFTKQSGGLYGYPRMGVEDAYGTSRQDIKVYNANLRYTRTFSPTFIGEMMAAVHRAPKSSGTLADNTPWANQLGLPNPFGESGWPTMYAGQFGFDGDNRKDEMLTAYIYQPNFTWVRGNHTVKFGGQLRYEQNHVREMAQAAGSHDFGADWTALYDGVSERAMPYTGDGFASMALGLGTFYGVNFNRGYFYFRQLETGLYAEDTWKVTPRLTLVLGLRYDRWSPYKEKFDRLANVDLRTLGNTFQVVTPHDTAMEQIQGLPPSLLDSWAARGLTWKTANQVGMPGALLPADNNNFGPRIGVAYKITPRTVLRGSYGEYFWTMPLSQILQSSRTNPPFNLFYENPLSSLDGTSTYAMRTPPQDNYFIGKGAFINTEGIVALPSTARGITIWDAQNWRDGRSQSWHFTLEHEIRKMTALRFSYIGTHATGMEQRFSVNSREAQYNYVARTGQAPPTRLDELRVNPDWSSTGVNKTGYSNTHALHAEFERRFNNGLALQFFYVFTRSLTTSDAGGFTSGGGSINSTNGIYQVPENIQLLGGGNLSYDDRLRLGYQNSTNVPPHNFTWNGLYDLPFGRGKRFGGNVSRALDAVIGGWQLAGLGTWRSGFWSGINAGLYQFGDPSLSADERLELTFAGRRQLLWFKGDFDPTLASGVDQAALQRLVPADRSQRVARPVGASFNNQVQQVLANGTVRNTSITETLNWNSRAFFLGPSAFTADLSLFKNLSITERVKLRLTADFFNAFNHPLNGSPNANTGLVDLSVQSNEPRVIQFSARISW